MKNLIKTMLLALLVAAPVAMTTSCAKDGEFESKMKEAGEKIEEGVDEAGDNLKDGIEDAGDKIEDWGDDVEDATD